LRPLNLAALWLAVEAGSRLSGGPAASPASLVPVLTAAFGYVRNDAVDRDADRVNRPGRPVPSGAVPRGVALGISWTLLVAASAIALATVPGQDPARWVLFAAGAARLYLYSPWLKSLGPTGPLVVALLAALAVLWGGLSGPAASRAAAAATLAATVTFARECAKDLEDHPGDLAAGKRTWPVAAGEPRVRAALRWSSLAGLALVPVPWLRGEAGAIYLVVAGLSAAPALAWCASIPARTAEDAGRRALMLKVALVGGIVGLWIGGVGGTAAPR
jgi:geranylgeranylglycerol-phosphate geranylgeranyltransferase